MTIFCVEDRAEVIGGKVPEFFSALEQALPRIEATGARCLGAFHTAGPTGRWNEVFVYWEMDGWETYAEVLNQLGGPGSLCDAADPHWGCAPVARRSPCTRPVTAPISQS